MAIPLLWEYPTTNSRVASIPNPTHKGQHFREWVHPHDPMNQPMGNHPHLRSSWSSAPWWWTWCCWCGGSRPAGLPEVRWWSSPGGAERTPFQPETQWELSHVSVQRHIPHQRWRGRYPPFWNQSAVSLNSWLSSCHIYQPYFHRMTAVHAGRNKTCPTRVIHAPFQDKDCVTVENISIRSHIQCHIFSGKINERMPTTVLWTLSNGVFWFVPCWFQNQTLPQSRRAGWWGAGRRSNSCRSWPRWSRRRAWNRKTSSKESWISV